MKTLIAFVVAIAVFFAAPAMSYAGKGKDKKGVHGKVTAVDDHSITISNKKSGESKTLKVEDSTKVSVDGQDGKKISDVKVGMKVKVSAGSSKDSAGTITAKTKGKKGKKKTKV